MEHRFISNTQTSIDTFIGAEEAKFYLENYNNQNRPLSLARVSEYINIINRGEFQNGHDVFFRENDGEIMDWQHRAKALVVTNTGFLFHVRYGIPAWMQPYINQGGKNSLGWMIQSLSGKKIHPKAILAAKNFILLSENWQYGKVSESAIVESYQEHKEEIDNLVSVLPNAGRLSKAGFLLASAIYMGKCPDRAKIFVQSVLTGLTENDTGLPSNDARWKLREHLQSNSGGGMPAIKADYNLTVSAIHKFHFGQTVQKLYPIDKWKIEDYTDKVDFQKGLEIQMS